MTRTIADNPPAKRLLAWYDRHARDLPWRIGPRDRAMHVMPDPYRVWLSEIMLQQTTVAAVRDYFAAFITRWPTLPDLARASEDEVLKAWAGLGYYSRARNLKKCADTVMAKHNGQFPRDLAGLKALPGIGDYTAAAIAAIAFDRPAAVVDGNVERVITRYLAIATPMPAAKKEVHTAVSSMVPEARPGDFAQASMDLGAVVCTPRAPSCPSCPLRDDCRALDSDPLMFPVKPPKKTKPLRRGAAYIAVNREGAVLLEKRDRRGLLAGMTQVPTSEWSAQADGATGTEAAPFEASWHGMGSIRHVFTHFELVLDVWLARQVDRSQIGDGQWWSAPIDLPDEALPTVIKKAISCAMTDAFKGKQS